MVFGENGRARAKAWAAGIDTARRRAGLVVPEPALLWLRGTLSGWLAAEVAPGRLFPWLPVAFGFGVVLYFTADREPVWWVAGATAAGAVALAVAAHRHAVLFPLLLGAAAIAAGFAVASGKRALIAHPVLQKQTYAREVSGFVETREERARSDRIVVRVSHLDAYRLKESPERVRVAVRKGTAPAVGDHVTFKARLSPPLQPLRPGGYDFARDMYFQRIGASGFVLGKIAAKPMPEQPGWRLRAAAIVDGIRESIDDRIRANLDGDRGSIASALITGKRDAITAPVNDAMYVSSLAHVLSISGYHMAVVAGVVFFILRALLALVPALAVRHPIKKWSALAALAAATFYLVLSGAEVATQRSFIMIAIVLIGVMVDRATLTFRTLAVAAFAVLLLAPEAVVHPSFQMSFAATLALIAVYQNGLSWRLDRDSSLAARVALWGGREVVALVLASLVAGLATTPYAAYHFHRLAPYGVLANLLAMPVVSAWVMPMGILGLIAIPFGFDAPFWHLMGTGLDWMIAVALWVTSLPGALGRIAAFGTGPLLLGTAGLLLLCLLRSPLRWSGAALGIVAALWAVLTPQPDILVAADGSAAAIRTASGHLSILHAGRDTFAVREWLAADADGRTVKDDSLKDGIRCDDDGCVGSLKNGRLVAMPRDAAAFAEDCTRAAVVVSAQSAPGDCAALLIDRPVWQAKGALALRSTAAGFDVMAAQAASVQRPWSPQRPTATTRRTTTRPAPDATPAPGDLDAGD